MRMSDWSPDVCSSDLLQLLHGSRYLRGRWSATVLVESIKRSVFVLQPGQNRSFGPTGPNKRVDTLNGCNVVARQETTSRVALRSEEHTSELQSLMRISYAVFCLKKKKNKETTNEHANEAKRRVTS